MKKSPRLTIRFTQPNVLSDIKSLAKTADRKPSEYARIVLADHVKNKKAAAAR
jgi:hypothetical protein